MAYTIEQVFPSAMPNGYKAQQAWYRAVDGQDLEALNLEDHLVMRAFGSFTTLIMAPVSGDITGLALDIAMAITDETAQPMPLVIDGGKLGNVLEAKGNILVTLGYHPFDSGGQHNYLWCVTRLRPHLAKASTNPSVLDIGLIQSPIIV